MAIYTIRIGLLKTEVRQQLKVFLSRYSLMIFFSVINVLIKKKELHPYLSIKAAQKSIDGLKIYEWPRDL